MGCYICDKCGTVDNSAIGGFWDNYRKKIAPMCSECNTGKWHGYFPKQHWSSIGSPEMLIKMERRHDGSMINAVEYFKRHPEFL